MVSLLALQDGQYLSSHRQSVKRESIALKVVHAGLFLNEHCFINFSRGFGIASKSGFF